MKCVKKCITQENDELSFVNKCMMSVESFMELLFFFYVNFTLVL